MKNAIKLTLAASAVALLTACGGGGGGSGDAGGDTTQVASAPVAIFYRNFDLGKSVIPTVLQTCNSSATQIETMRMTFDPVTSTYTTYRFIITGNLTLPNANSCSTAGMTGNVSSVRLTIDGSLAYVMSGINIDANYLTSGWQYFWSALNSASQTIQASSPNSTTEITCSDTGNVVRTLGFTNPGDITDFIAACTR
jgi:hypothetical protein